MMMTMATTTVKTTTVVRATHGGGRRGGAVSAVRASKADAVGDHHQRAAVEGTFGEKVRAGVVGLAACATLGMATPAMTRAGELEIMQTPRLEDGYVVDDAGVLSRSSATAINKSLKELEDQTGYRLNVVTVRKLVFETDPFAFGDKVLEKWYPTVEEGNNKGNLLLVKSTKDGALVGGPKFLKAVGDDLIDSVLTSNYGVNLEQEKYNEALVSSVKRVAAVLEGKADPGPPEKFEAAKGSNFKTRSETNEKRDVFANVVIGLLVISFVVPMLQYAGYVVGDPDFDE